MEQMLDYFNISPDQRVKIAAMHLEGAPLRWFRWLNCTKRTPLFWLEFEKGIVTLYDEKSVSSYLGELSKLKQEGNTLEYYQEKFMHLSHLVHELPEEFFIECFISGLRDAVKYELIAKKPITMEEAMRLAKL